MVKSAHLEKLRKRIEEFPNTALYKCENGIYAKRALETTVDSFPAELWEELSEQEKKKFNHLSEIRVHRISGRNRSYT